MRLARVCLLAAVCLVTLPAQEPPKAELLWPDGAPGALGTQPEDQPTLTAFLLPKTTGSGTAVVICPGGGYSHLSMDKEGYQVARWLNSLGVSAFVVQYRLGPRYHHPAELQDAQHAVRTVRRRAAEFGLQPDRIGIMGFSAGGHLASTAGTHFDTVEGISSRPDFLVLCYPVISLGTYTHAGSKLALLGANPDPQLLENLSNELQVTAQTPPAFLFHTTNDATVPVENSVLFYSALRKAGVPAEMHLYERGPHGVGLAPNDPVLATWPARLADWLRVHGLLTAK